MTPAPPPPGDAAVAGTRPRVEGEREHEILDATLRVLLATGYERLTLDQVATEARASKATLYRRWSGKPALVVDALIKAKGQHHSPEAPDTGSLRGDLLASFCHSGAPFAEQARVMALVITAMHTDAEFAALFREHFLAPKIAQSQAVYARAAARGEVADGVDLALVGPALAGILLHRQFVLGEPVGDDVVEDVVDQIILPAVTGCPATSR